MNCLFCKEDSGSSRSIEHIVPESLGNTKATLPPGIVCDPCNNYFARKVEKPFLESLPVLALRFFQLIPNKRGRVPPLHGVMDSGIPAVLHRPLQGPFVASVDVPPDEMQRLLKRGRGMIITPAPGDNWESYPVGRFLAKASLEAMAERLVEHPGGLAYLVNEKQLDPIRTYARRGTPASWPYHCRRIYEANSSRAMPDGETSQVIWESDFLQTAHQELYFVLAIFGLELSINMGGPEIEGYLKWLEDHDHASPLYFGKNAQVSEP
jgi:hypothetical protein